MSPAGLAGAIQSHRVGHAYLFTGARGVGKTSAARILAKALNCVHGPTPTPCNQCDICRAISSGDDIDVLEIDGASNRGIDEIRQLRQNVNVRPSRARFKIYIIDEVHMLTREAFNALLKTLEEPPEHVKFIFCTTEAEKIPITILSRCQRFDFAGISTDAIARRLRQIVEAEGVAAETRRSRFWPAGPPARCATANRCWSNCCRLGTQQITVDSVHALLGTAGDARLDDAGRALGRARSGGSFGGTRRGDGRRGRRRPIARSTAGLFPRRDDRRRGLPRRELFCTPGRPNRGTWSQPPSKLGLETILAVLQIIDHTLSRLRFSAHGRMLAELALVRIAKLDELDKLADVVGRARAAGGAGQRGTRGSASGGMAKKKAELNAAAATPPTASAVSGHRPTVLQSLVAPAASPHLSAVADSSSAAVETISQVLTASNALEMFRAAALRLGDMTADSALQASAAAIAARQSTGRHFPSEV